MICQRQVDLQQSLYAFAGSRHRLESFHLVTLNLIKKYKIEQSSCVAGSMIRGVINGENVELGNSGVVGLQMRSGKRNAGRGELGVK